MAVGERVITKLISIDAVPSRFGNQITISGTKDTGTSKMPLSEYKTTQHAAVSKEGERTGRMIDAHHADGSRINHEC